MKKISLLLASLVLVFTLAACGGSDAPINVYTRDTSSGTRAGFFGGIGYGDAAEDDSLLVEGFVTQDNDGIFNAMQTDVDGIGYVSLASYVSNSTVVKGLAFEGVEPSLATAGDGSYGLTRPFNYILRAEWPSAADQELAEAFVAFMLSSDGGDIIADEGAAPLAGANYTWDSVSDEYPICSQDNRDLTIRFRGSDSVQAIAEALAAAFSPECGDVQTDNNHTGSSDGYKRTQGSESATDGVNWGHVGFASRPFKTEESDGPANTRGQLASDAIVAIVHNDNAVDGLTAQQLIDIYTGEITSWSELTE